TRARWPRHRHPQHEQRHHERPPSAGPAARRRIALHRLVRKVAMSRIGKQPVAIPSGVKVNVADGKVRVEGPKGKLELAYHPAMQVNLDDKTKAIQVTRPNDERQNRSLHGLTRSLIANMVEGVSKGFEKKLKIEGIGYQARM